MMIVIRLMMIILLLITITTLTITEAGSWVSSRLSPAAARRRGIIVELLQCLIHIVNVLVTVKMLWFMFHESLSLSLSLYIYIYIHNIYIYIYIIYTHISLPLSLYLYIYIYTFLSLSLYIYIYILCIQTVWICMLNGYVSEEGGGVRRAAVSAVYAGIHIQHRYL